MVILVSSRLIFSMNSPESICTPSFSFKVANLPWFCAYSASVLPGPPVHLIRNLTRRRFLLTGRVMWHVQSPFSTVMPCFSISLCIPNCRCESPSVIKVLTPSADSSSCNNCLARSLPPARAQHYPWLYDREGN